jgi:hypothetical protein
MTPVELTEKKMQFFKTVLESIAGISDVASSNDLGELARLALEEEFCEICGTHPGDMGCSVCGRHLCDICYPNVMEACSICGEPGNVFLDKLYDADERMANEK